ncbi:hypothetical protein FO519_005950 [Halicephalobus sp. NKZ332]|nr:hypothetical protein FO519_005950 [Halicephalobus sp. NKZ332]
MGNRQAVVKKLSAVETLGCVTVICSDKTGTLTKNEMTACVVIAADGSKANVSGVGYDPTDGECVTESGQKISGHNYPSISRVIEIGCVCNNAQVINGTVLGQPTEGALMVLAAKTQLEFSSTYFKRLKEQPFTPENKWMAVFVEPKSRPGETEIMIKGALDRILDICQSFVGNDNRIFPINDNFKDQVSQIARGMGNSGLRVIAVASGKDMSSLTYAGLIGILDPPRPGCKDSVEIVQSAGVSVKMITGDARETACSIGARLQIYHSSDSCLSGEQIDEMTDHDLELVIKSVVIFYRASPRHKLRIVKALQNIGEVVAMTGDGVNDAVALKKADIGISMGISGTDVCKEAADMVLMDDNFLTIRSAIEEGKGIYHNITNFVKFQLSTSVAALSLIALSTLFHFENPLNAMQILWINIIMDGPPAQSLGVEPVDADIIKQKPRDVKQPLITKKLIISILTSAGIIIVGTMFIFYKEIGCYSHDVMMKEVGLEFPKDNVSWVQIYLYEFGFGEAKLPQTWNKFITNKATKEANAMQETANSLLWEMLVPFDHSRPWDIRGSLIFLEILQRSQQECSALLKSGKFYEFAAGKEFDLVVVDHFIQECITTMASLLNATTVQYSNWPIADGYITSLNVPANPSYVTKTGTYFSGKKMNFFERARNTFFHIFIIVARTIQSFVINFFYRSIGHPEVELNNIEANHLFYASRGEFLAEPIRPISNRIKHFGCSTCKDIEEYIIKSPSSLSETKNKKGLNSTVLHLINQNSYSSFQNSSESINVSRQKVNEKEFINICHQNLSETISVTFCHQNLSEKGSENFNNRNLEEKERIDFDDQNLNNTELINISYENPKEEEFGTRFLQAQAEFPEIDFEELESKKFVLVSFGSVAKIKAMPKKIFKIFIEEFAKLNRLVIWSTNSAPEEFLNEEERKNIPENIRLIKWVPLKLLLAHKNLDLFICHGGINTVNELLNFGVPVLGLPLQGDQPSNLNRIKELEIGITTVHGPLRIYRGHGIYRFLWLLAMVLCAGLCIWQVSTLIRNYVQKPTASQVSFILPEGMELPLVTVCNYNNVRKTFVQSLNNTAGGNFPDGLLDYMAASYLEPQLVLAIANDSVSALLDGEEMMQNFTSTYDPNFTIDNFFLDAGPICESTLKICAFAGTVFDCCKNTETILTDMGKCFKIDVSKVNFQNPLQIQSGVSNGLQIFADYHKEEQADELKEDKTSSTKYLSRYIWNKKSFSSDAYGIFAQSLETGFRVYVHSKNEVPFMSSEGITVSPGTRVYSAISPTRYLLLPEESWGKCIESWPEEMNHYESPSARSSGRSEASTEGPARTERPKASTEGPARTESPEGVFGGLFGKAEEPEDSKTFSNKYSATKCKALCRARFYNSHCGCSPFVYNIDRHYKVCSAFEIYECIQKIQNNSDNEVSQSVPIPDCSFCKVECDRWAYHTTNYVTFNVYYRDMAYTEYEEVQSTTFTQTVSNVGGTFGMFLGISFISITEIIVYLWKTTWVFISKKRRNHLIEKKHQEQEREKTLEMTLKTISSKNNPDDNEDQPISFKRIAHSIRRKVTNVFPRKNTMENGLINDAYIDEKLHGTGKTNFDKQRKSGFVEVRLDPNQLVQILKETNKTNPGGRRRSNSCPRETPPWLDSVISLSSIPIKESMEIQKFTKIQESPLEKDYSETPDRSVTPDSVFDDVSEASTAVPQGDPPNVEEKHIFTEL